jgi:transposase-like protein
MPVVREICRQVGIGRSTLDYWLSKSERGQVGDGFDIPTGETDEDGKPVTERFHKQLQHALMNGVEKVEVAAFEIATDGRAEPLVHKGRLQYQIDQDLVDLGFSLSECYVRGPNGKPLPESIFKQDPEMMRFILQARKPEMYGKRERHDHVVSGGVLVVGVKKTAAELEKAYGGVQEIQDVEFVEVEDGK